MPLAKLRLRPGVNVELTPTANQGGYSQSQFVRFFSGQLQKLGGWDRLPSLKLIGICRGLFSWADLVGTIHLAAGTDQRLTVITGGLAQDATPIEETSNITPAVATTSGSVTASITDASYLPNIGDWINLVTPVSQGGIILVGYYQVASAPAANSYAITTATAATLTTPSGGLVPVFNSTSGSATISVTFPNHGQIVGSNFAVTTSTTIAGLTLSGNYSVATVTDTSHFTITAGALANATATVSQNSGNMQIAYLLPSGVSQNTAVGGYGAGPYGGGQYGAANAGTNTALVTVARTWSLDHFGQDLIASPDLGAIYYWTPPGPDAAQVLSMTAPTINRVVFAMAQAQILIAAGSSSGGVYAPTLVRWCDSGDFTDWTPSATNQAGSYQLPTGSYVTAGLSVGLGALIWTDNALWSMTYQGLPFVFGFNQIGVECEALSKRAPASAGSLVVWPSRRGWFSYQGGGVQPLECPVYDFFFDNLDFTQTEKVTSAVNSLFNEIAWYFPRTDGQTGYVKWNYLEQVWDYGLLDRTAWSDHSASGLPVGTDSQGYIYEHESGDDAAGSPMISYATTGYYDLQEGELMTYFNYMIPDFVIDRSASISVTIQAIDYTYDVPRTYGPFTITNTTRRINCNIRGRRIAFQIGSNTLGGFWRIGAFEYAPATAGTRP